jgi:hypothetical protein
MFAFRLEPLRTLRTLLGIRRSLIYQSFYVMLGRGTLDIKSYIQYADVFSVDGRPTSSVTNISWVLQTIKASTLHSYGQEV